MEGVNEWMGSVTGRYDGGVRWMRRARRGMVWMCGMGLMGMVMGVGWEWGGGGRGRGCDDNGWKVEG